MIFRQLFDASTSTFTYLLADEDSREAVIVDTVFEQHLRDAALIRELGLNLRFVLDTHVHADHVTGAWLMRQAFGCSIAVARAAGAEGADRFLVDGDEIVFGAFRLLVRATPGHTNGCLTYVCPEEKKALTGDALLIRGAGRTDFQGGDASKLYSSVHEQIFSLDDDYLLYPGHDYSGRSVTTVLEEKSSNPRLSLQVRQKDFVAYMENLGLPHPKKMDLAVPANLSCGKPPENEGEQPAKGWGEVVRTYAGVWQVEPEWVYSHRRELLLLDVRTVEEFTSDGIGHIEGSSNLPLSQLRSSLASLDRKRPIITICPSGARSAVAAQIIENDGRFQAANLRGGVLGWAGLGYPIASYSAASS